MPIRFATPIKYFMLSLSLVLLSSTSLYAQSDTPHNHLDFVSTNPYVFVTFRNTDEYVDQFNAFFAKLAINSNGALALPPAEGTAVQSVMEIIGMDEAIERDVTIDDAWLGDQFSFVIQAPHNPEVSYAYSNIFAMIDIADMDAFFQSVKSDVEVFQQDDYVLVGDHIIVINEILIYKDAQDPAAFIQFLKDQPALADTDSYQANLERLPADNYPITGYLGIDNIISLSRSTDFVPPVTLNGDMVFGAFYPDERTIAVDFVQSELRIDEQEFSTLNTDFAENIPANVHLALQGSNADIPLQMMVSLLNQTSAFIDGNSFDGYQLFNVGGMFKHMVITTIAGFTGLNVERDIIQQADGDYALAFRYVPTNNWVETSFLAHINDDDAINYIFDSLTEAAQAYGVEVAIQERHLHAPNILRNLIELDGRYYPHHPSVELSIIHQDDVLALGNTPLVNHAIGRDGMLSQQATYQEAIERHPDDLIGLLYLNTPLLAEDIVKMDASMVGLRPYEVWDLQNLFLQAETIMISTHIQDELPVSRLTFTLPHDVPILFDTGATSPNTGE